MKRIGIIGAGRFGSALAEYLAARGAEVVLMDQDRATVQHLAAVVSNAVQGDATDILALAAAGFQDCDTGVVAIGSNMEGSILATMNLKELKVPHVIAKAVSDLHAKVLAKIGANLVVNPNRERAERLAQLLTSPSSALEFFDVTDGVSVVEMRAPAAFVGKTLVESGARQQYGLTVLAIKRSLGSPDTRPTVILPTAEDRIEEGDTLVVFGPDDKIGSLV